LIKKVSDFLKFMVCLHGQGGFKIKKRIFRQLSLILLQIALVCYRGMRRGMFACTCP